MAEITEKAQLMASDGAQVGTKIEEAIALQFDPGLGQWEGLKRNATLADLEDQKDLDQAELDGNRVRLPRSAEHKCASHEGNASQT
jgi:hypothetical protein